MLKIDNILLSPQLYIVSTPIGNLKDITLRALSILKSSDIIACEDTRVTKKLLSVYGIKSKKLVSVHEHTSQQKLIFLINKIKKGESIALVSDSGTPVISDPGIKLIILAEQWPYRLSWIFHKLEDYHQCKEPIIKDSQNNKSSCSKKWIETNGNVELFDIYNTIRPKLLFHYKLEQFITLDYDPDIFIDFMQENSLAEHVTSDQ